MDHLKIYMNILFVLFAFHAAGLKYDWKHGSEFCSHVVTYEQETNKLMRIGSHHIREAVGARLIYEKQRKRRILNRRWNNRKKEVESQQIKDNFLWNESLKLHATRSAQQVGLNFTAATVSDSLDPLIIPPNLNGAVGVQQYIVMTYNVIRSFDKSTGLPDGVLNIDAASFFGVGANDVRISFDRFSQRWFMSCEGIDSTTGKSSTIILAVSRDGVVAPSTKWDFYTFSNAQMIPQIAFPGSGDLDYQQLAIDQKAVYISADAFDRRGYFVGTSALVIQKNSLRGAGSPVSAKVFYGILPGLNINLPSGFTPPADNFDPEPSFGYIVNASCGYSGAVYNKIFLYRVVDQGTRFARLSRQITIKVPTYADVGNAPHKGNLFGVSAYLQTGGCNFTAPHVRNHQLYVCHSVLVSQSGAGTPKGDRIGVRWYQFDLTGDSTGQGRGVETELTVPVLVQWGTLFDSSVTATPDFYYIPSIMTNKRGDLVVAGTVSGLETYTNVAYAGRLASDAKNTLRGPLRLTDSTNPYNFGPFVNPFNANIGQRWGDLSSLSPDPIDDLDIWSTQEFAAVQNGWGVQVTQLKPAYNE